MRYIKFIIAALLSLLNVWLCSRTLDSNFNPMAFLGLILYSFNACDLIFVLSKLCLETAITFAIFYDSLFVHAINEYCRNISCFVCQQKR